MARELEIVSEHKRKLQEFRRRLVRADSLREFEKLDDEARELIDRISDDIIAVSEAPVTTSTIPKAPRSGKNWLAELYEPVVETYVAPEEFDYGVKGSLRVTHAEEVLGPGTYKKREYKDPQTQNPKMNRSIKGKAVRVLIQQLEAVKDDVYDSLFDVSETIDRLKRRS